MKITILGASGNVGSCAAFYIAMQGLARELVLVDTFKPDFAEQQDFDIGSAVTGTDVRVTSGGYEALAGSDIVLIAAGSAQTVTSRTEVLPQNLPIIKEMAGKIVEFCPGAVVITATNPVCPLNYAVYLAAGLNRRQCIGYSFNDSIRFRMYHSQALGIPSSRVEGMVVGEHGNTQVPLFSSVKVDGQPYAVNEKARRVVRRNIENLPSILEPQRIKTGRTAAWTSAVGLAAVCRAIVHDTGEVIPCSAILNGEYGYNGLSTTVPTALGKEGVRDIMELELEPDERTRLDKSVQAMQPYLRVVEESLGVNG